MTFNWQRKGNKIGFLFYLWSFRHDLNVQKHLTYKDSVLPIELRKHMERLKGNAPSCPAWKAGAFTSMLQPHNCTAWHSITKLNHFIASPRFISLYYIMYLFISCNIFISQGLPYVKTFLIPYVNQSGLSHCPITFSTFRLLNSL